MLARRTRLQELPVQVRRRSRIDRLEEPDARRRDVDGRRAQVLLCVATHVRVQARRADARGERNAAGTQGASEETEVQELRVVHV